MALATGFAARGREAAVNYIGAICIKSQQEFARRYLGWRVGQLKTSPSPADCELTIICADVLRRTIDMLLFGATGHPGAPPGSSARTRRRPAAGPKACSLPRAAR
jgi:hypothetical protein